MHDKARRRMIRGAGVLLTGSALGIAASGGIADTPTAADASLTGAGDEATVRNGSLAAVRLALTGNWKLAVPRGERPKTVVVDVLAGTDAESMTNVASAESEEVFLEANGTESFSVDLLEAGVVSGDDLVPAEGGATVETKVHVGAEMRLEDEAGLTIAADSQSDTATVAIEKSAYDPDEHGSLAGTGELVVELE